MAVGDSFGGLLSLSDPAPPPEVAPLNQEEGELGRAQKLKAQQRGNTVIGGPFATQTVRDAELADYYEQEDARLAGRRRNEAAGIHAADAAQATAERLKAQFGTDDPHTAALVKATGAFDSDLAQRMKLDPEGTKASVDRAAALLGKNGASEAPKGPEPNLLTSPGLLQPGNLDLTVRPRVRNADGSTSTIRSMSFEENGKEILIPTVSKNGRVLSNDAAISLYHKTGEHLGIFDTPENATKHAEMLHEREASGQGSRAPERQFSVGKGAHGEQYFTNLSREELKADHHTADTIRGEATPPPVTGLKKIEPGVAGGDEGGAQSAADILFQGRLDKAQMIAGTPEREEKHTQALAGYGEELLKLGHDEDATTARQKLQDDLMGGRLGKLGIKPKEAAGLDKVLIRRAKTTAEMAEGNIDRQFYIPWHKSAKKPGLAADKAEPATILNPGGAQPVADNVQQQNLMATSERSAHIEDTLPQEASTTTDYALGSPTAARLKKVAAGEREARKQKRVEQFGFDYEPPTLGGFLSGLMGK